MHAPWQISSLISNTWALTTYNMHLEPAFAVLA
jgi:hypothetical protein